MSRSAKFRFRLLMLVGILGAMSLFPARAEAHLNSTGLGPTYDGLTHFLLSPEDILPVLALALFAGQRGAAHGRRVLFILPGTGSWGVVGLMTTATNGAGLTFVSFLLLGGLLAADAKLSISTITVLAVWSGFFMAT
jgi:urease accessory protein